MFLGGTVMSVRKCFDRLIFFVYIFLALSTLNSEALASLMCFDCHGTKITQDNRPVDSPYRNISTGGFRGNHKNHLGYGAIPGSCQKCHPGSAGFVSGHRDGQIKISGNINSSPLVTTYNNTTTAFPQRAVYAVTTSASQQNTYPALGTCNNVNCHFENPTPVWGTDALTFPNDCSRCHGTPPSSGATGAAGSHGRHDVYYGGVNGGFNTAECNHLP